MNQKPPILDMTIEGEFVDSPRGSPGGPPGGPQIPFGTRVMIWSAVAAAIAISVAVVVFALWLLAFLIPVALIAAVIAYGVFRFQVWRNGGSIPGGTIYWVRRR